MAVNYLLLHDTTVQGAKEIRPKEKIERALASFNSSTHIIITHDVASWRPLIMRVKVPAPSATVQVLRAADLKARIKGHTCGVKLWDNKVSSNLLLFDTTKCCGKFKNRWNIEELWKERSKCGSMLRAHVGQSLVAGENNMGGDYVGPSKDALTELAVSAEAVAMNAAKRGSMNPPPLLPKTTTMGTKRWNVAHLTQNYMIEQHADKGDTGDTGMC